MRWLLSEGPASICGWASKHRTSSLGGGFSCFKFILALKIHANSELSILGSTSGHASQGSHKRSSMGLAFQALFVMQAS